MTNPPEQVDPLTKALDTLNLRELTGDSSINGAEAASLIRKGIRERNQWDTENEIWAEVVAGAVALCEAKDWECDPDHPMMLQNLAERLGVGEDKDTWARYISWCLSVDPHSLHYFEEGPLGEFQLQLMRTNASNLINLFHRHMPGGPG